MQFLSTLIDRYKSECQRGLLESHKFPWANHKRQSNGYVALLSQTSIELQDKQQKAYDLTLLVDKALNELKLCPLISHELNKRLEKILINRIDEILVGYKETLDNYWPTGDRREFRIQQVHAKFQKNHFCYSEAIIHTIRISPNSPLLVGPPIAQATLTLAQHSHDYLVMLATLPRPTRDRDSSGSDENDAIRTFKSILVEINTDMIIERSEKIEKGANCSGEFVEKWSNYQALWDTRMLTIFEQLGDDVGNWVLCQDLREIKTPTHMLQVIH